MNTKGWIIITIILAVVLAGSLFYVFGVDAGTRLGRGIPGLSQQTSIDKATGSENYSFPAGNGWWNDADSTGGGGSGGFEWMPGYSFEFFTSGGEQFTSDAHNGYYFYYP
ncbi:hypothetical protein ACFL0Z_03795 [Patescibacteria group bacterium]